ncbi:MAG: hypothetical protein LBP95_08570 [Deltaproteobacteria bacterium]|nr:hypothetical protein [Deltaproteobacteria bacterium]
MVMVMVMVVMVMVMAMAMAKAFNKNGVLFSAGLVAVFRETASVFNTGDAVPDKAGFA